MFKKILYTFLAIIVILVLLLLVTGNGYVFKGIGAVYLKGRTTANIFDYSDFDNHVVANSSSKIQELPLHKDYNQIPLSDTLQKEIDRFGTTSFLVLKNGEIIQEFYFGEGNKDSISNSFSMAKTITTMLTQKAIEDGYIPGWETPMVQYITEYKEDSLAKKVSLADLSKMTSGFDWQEDYYFPLNPTAKAYYGKNMDKVILNRQFVDEPGAEFRYLSGNTQLLGYVLQRALPEGTSISDYLSEKFWKPLGMRRNALWSLDKEGGIEKTYCCVHSTARDFSKLGLLLMNNGKWQGDYLIDSAFVQRMKMPIPTSGGRYGYGLWMDEKNNPSIYFFQGHLGQFIIMVPEENIVIVRLGEQKDKRPHRFGNPLFTRGLYVYVNETLNSLQTYEAE